MNQLTLLKGNSGFELPIEGNPNWILKREAGYSAVQSLVAAAGACGGYVYQHILENSKIPYRFEKIEATYETSEIKPEPLTKISFIFYVDVAEEYRGRAERSLKLVSKNCPVIQSLDPKIEVIEAVRFVD
ncbi:OsmC family protein [Enterococcus asini]|uniref:OsmC family protein n=1 Tax=Enterococcus asini TaxID=57732 RepID=UPI00288E1D5A|nr:OsmC family protein [Enterococcus asini]MDT2755946.1 OsmC family protein [Enterococcus asini]